MTEVEKLVLQVDNKGATETNKALQQLDKSAKATEDTFGKLKAGVLALVAAAASLGIVAKKLIDATKSYQGFMAQLETSTGSVEKATKAYQAIEAFATTTPFALKESMEAFIMLTNRGLTPSERALRSYGDTASAAQQSLGDMVTAVANATTGEFDNFKKFGVKIAKENEMLKITFRGTTTEVKNNAAAIEEAFIKMGEKSFAGGMARQMDTLNGKMSNFGDAWDQLWVAISRSGADKILIDIFSATGDSIVYLRDLIASGSLQAAIRAYTNEWKESGDAVAQVFQAVTNVIKGATTLWGLYPKEAGVEFVKFFQHLPVNASAATQMILAWFMKMGAKIAIVFDDMWSSFKIHLEQMVEIAKAGGAAIAQAIDASTDVSFKSAMENINGITTRQKGDLKKRIDAEKKAEDDKYDHIGQLIAHEADQRITQTEETLAESSQLYDKYQAELAARQADKSDKLAEFKVKGDGSTTDDEPSKAAIRAAAKQQKIEEEIFAKHIEFVDKGIETEKKILDDAYEERKTRVLDNESLTWAEKKDLVLRLMSDSLVSEEEAVRRSYQTRHDFIISSTMTSESVKTALLLQLTEAREKQLADIEKKHQDERLGQASTFFGNIASIGSTFGKKGFKIAQAAAIAEATIDTYKGATGAYASLAKIPYIGPALGAAAAAAAIVAGMARVAQIKSQTYSGAYAHGGMVPAGKYGLVGEAGPELISGPAVVTSAATTAAKSSTSGVRAVQINNYGAPATATTQMDGDTLRVILKPMLEQTKKEARDELAGEITKGGGKVSIALERNYALSRANRS